MTRTYQTRVKRKVSRLVLELEVVHDQLDDDELRRMGWEVTERALVASGAVVSVLSITASAEPVVTILEG